MNETGRHAKPWNMARRVHDRTYPRLFPGNHHPIWHRDVTKVVLMWN